MKNKVEPESARDVLSSDDENIDEEAEMNAEARALRQAIKEGVFDKLNISTKGKPATDEMGDESGSGSDSEEEDAEKQKKNDLTRNKALVAKTLELEAEKKDVPWLESFDVITTQPLPFSKHNGGNPLHVHDDLKREVSFYNVALEAVQLAKQKCYEAKVPFTRPDDFFAEMVKSDEHMAKIKDRLIFESKKIAAFGQRKANREQKLRAKEARSKKLQEKAKYKKDNLKAVDNWAKSAASNRLADGKVRDGEDQQYLQSLEQRQYGKPNQKRENMNKKYGFGGKRGHFKQMDQKTINDMSNYNPYGNFGGVGSKKRGEASGNKRAGKRARDAKRQKH